MYTTPISPRKNFLVCYAAGVWPNIILLGEVPPLVLSTGPPPPRIASTHGGGRATQPPLSQTSPAVGPERPASLNPPREALSPRSQPMYLRASGLPDPKPRDPVERCLFADSDVCSTDASEICKARKKTAKLRGRPPSNAWWSPPAWSLQPPPPLLHTASCIDPCPNARAYPSVVTRGGRHPKRGGGQQPGWLRPPTPQEARQRLKVQALSTRQEIEDEAMDLFDFAHYAIQWRRNQRVWIRLQIQGPSRMMVEVVTTLGEPEPMWHQELLSLMVAVCWLLKQRACENLRINWIRK